MFLKLKNKKCDLDCTDTFGNTALHLASNRNQCELAILLTQKGINTLIKNKHNLKLQRLYYLIEPLTKLDNMIGLKNVKEDIFKTIIYYTTKQYTDEYLHTIINGPPGVGKTEFAKIYAEIFLRLGILKTNSFLEIKKDDLVAKYLGQTSHRTKELLENFSASLKLFSLKKTFKDLCLFIENG